MNKLKLLSSIFIMVIIIAIGNVVFATSSFKGTLVSSDANNLKAGEIITIKLNLSDINDDNGLMGLNGKLVFDENVFEPILINSYGQMASDSKSTITAISPWKNLLYNANFATDADNPVKTTGDALEIKLKVKDNINVQETVVKIENLVGSSGFEDIQAEDNSIQITIKAPTPTPTPQNVSSFKGTLVSSNTNNLKSGEIITIKLNLSDINDDNGLMGLNGKLVFDENVFEPILNDSTGKIKAESKSTITAISPWKNLLYNANFATDADNPVKTTGDALEIKLKVKDNINVKETVVKIENLVGSNGLEDIKAVDNPIQITIKAPTPTPTPTKEQTPTPTQKKVELPKAGVTTSVIVIALVILGGGIISFIKHRNMNIKF